MREVPRDALERAEGLVRLIGTINLTPEDWVHAQKHLEQLGIAVQSGDEPRFTDACSGLNDLMPLAVRGMAKVWERSPRDRKTPAPEEVWLLLNRVKHSLGDRLDQVDLRARARSSRDD